jgi:hypothetical protein
MAERREESIRILAPTTEGEWRHADTLIDELREWDVGESKALDFDPREVLGVFYPEDIGDIREDSAPPPRPSPARDGRPPLGMCGIPPDDFQHVRGLRRVRAPERPRTRHRVDAYPATAERGKDRGVSVDVPGNGDLHAQRSQALQSARVPGARPVSNGSEAIRRRHDVDGMCSRPAPGRRDPVTAVTSQCERAR